MHHKLSRVVSVDSSGGKAKAGRSFLFAVSWQTCVKDPSKENFLSKNEAIERKICFREGEEKTFCVYESKGARRGKKNEETAQRVGERDDDEMNGMLNELRNSLFDWSSRSFPTPPESFQITIRIQLRNDSKLKQETHLERNVLIALSLLSYFSRQSKQHFKS